MSADSGNSSPYSEIATEPVSEHRRLEVSEYMSRRAIFLSDFERYNPVQNMQMLAHHVFELSEGVGRMNNDLTDSRRMLDFVSSNQREHDSSIRNVGTDLDVVHHKVDHMGHSVDSMGNSLEDTRGELKNDIGGLREDINSLRSEMHSIRQETQQGIMDLKQLLMRLAPLRA